jgi:hypothetical protein
MRSLFFFFCSFFSTGAGFDLVAALCLGVASSYVTRLPWVAGEIRNSRAFKERVGWSTNGEISIQRARVQRAPKMAGTGIKGEAHFGAGSQLILALSWLPYSRSRWYSDEMAAYRYCISLGKPSPWA